VARGLPSPDNALKGTTMDSTGNFPKTGSGSTAADKAAEAVKDGVRTTEQGLNTAANSVAGKVNQLRDQAAPALERASAKAQEIGRKGMDALTDASNQIRDRALQASDAAVSYAKEEPIKALLVAAGAGALLMGLLALMVRSEE